MKIRKVITTFEDVIKVYSQCYASGLSKELDYFRELGKLTDMDAEKIAMDLVAGSHQRYLNFSTAVNYRDEAVRKLAEAKLWDKNFSNFESLYDAVCEVMKDIPYIKDLVKYDVAKRIGVMLIPEVAPESFVYIQNGAKVGAKNLLGKNFDDVKKLPKSCFESFFPNLSSVHIENILCIMKDYFTPKGVFIHEDEKLEICDFDCDSLKEC